MPRKSRAAIAAEAHAAANAALTKARESAAREIGCESTDFRAVRLATLMTAHEALQAALAVGERIDFKDLLDVDRALADLRKEIGVTKPMNLKVSFVDGVVGMFKCQHCHKENRVERYVAPEPPAKPVPKPYATITDASRVDGPPKPQPSPKVVELKRPSIHEPVTFADGAVLNPPLKRLEPRGAWHGYPIS